MVHLSVWEPGSLTPGRIPMHMKLAWSWPVKEAVETVIWLQRWILPDATCVCLVMSNSLQTPRL